MKLIKITTCGECPYIQYVPMEILEYDHCICERLEYKPVDPTTIDPDCPLEDERVQYITYDEAKGFIKIKEVGDETST